MANEHCFISYSNADALDFARKLADELEAGYPYINAWLDKRDIIPGPAWDDQLLQAIKDCKCLLFVMSRDSVADGSGCKMEWTRALSYKKPIALLRLHTDIELPLRLDGRQWIDFSNNLEAGMAKLRKFVERLDSPEGILDSLKYRLVDAERDLRRARGDEESRIRAEIEELKKQIEAQQKIVDNPRAVEEAVRKSIETRLEGERRPEKPVAKAQRTKFINQPPGVEQNYFQDRIMETGQVIQFLKNNAQRVMTVVGRGGAGKTTMICRLLKHIENGTLPDEFSKQHERISADGIVYLSETGSRKINFANLFADLCLLLSADQRQTLEGVYKNPQASTDEKTHQLLDAFSGMERVILLLDNFENIVDAEAQNIKDAELDEALKAILHSPQHPLKIIITTRVSPRQFELYEPARQRPLALDTGLAPQYAKEALRLMDEDNLVGIRDASEELLERAVSLTLGLPRALEALYAALRSDRYTTLDELLSMPTPVNVVEALVGEAFNRLDVNAQKVMQALAIFNRPVPPVAVDYLLRSYVDGMNSAPILQRLANMHFARKESGRFYLHPVDRGFAFSKIPAETSASNWNQKSLTLSAADYFSQARKPRNEWKKLDDIAAQLAEFDLRCTVGDYETAAGILQEIDYDYLLLWGHYRLLIDLHLHIKDKLSDHRLRSANRNVLGLAYKEIGKLEDSIKYYQQGLEGTRESKDRYSESAILGNLGLVFAALGDNYQAIHHYEQALVIARELGQQIMEGNQLGNLGDVYADRGDIEKAIDSFERELAIRRDVNDLRGENASLNSLGNAYSSLGDNNRAIEYYKQALAIAQEIGFQSSEAIINENMGQCYLSLSEYEKSEECFRLAVQIADEISFPVEQSQARLALAQLHVLRNDLDNACALVESALSYDVPLINHNANSLYGIITLRQGNASTARQIFARAITQANAILAKTPDLFDALDTKGMALCGLAICDDKKYVADAIEAFRAARNIAAYVGGIKRNLRWFDELAKCDEQGILKDVRKAVEGKE